MTWIDLLTEIMLRFDEAPLAIRADFLTDVADALRLKGDVRALSRRSYEEAETEWRVH